MLGSLGWMIDDYRAEKPSLCDDCRILTSPQAASKLIATMLSSLSTQ